MKKRLVVLALMAILAALLAPMSVSAAPDGSIVSIRTEVCTIITTVTSASGGDFSLELWDDGVRVSRSGFTLAAGETKDISLEMNALLGGSAPGVGVELLSGGTYIDYVDPYYPDLSSICGAGPDMVDIPSTAVVGAFVVTTPIYFAPQADAATTTVMEAGKTLWVYGVDASGKFYKVMMSGKFFWVPVSTMGPNYDAVWQGRPLPTDVVS